MTPRADNAGIADWSPQVFRSDTFRSLFEVIHLIPGFSVLLRGVIRVQLVIDANVVLGEIRWRLKRQNPAARSDLGEAIDSGIVIAIAPKHLLTEIDDEHLSRILRGTGKTILDAKREWKELRLKIRFYQPVAESAPSFPVIDPDDVAYAQTCEEVGADAIHTRDKHLTQMGARVVSATPDRILRDCARSNAVVMGISASSALAVTVSYASLRGLCALIEKAFEGFCSLPSWAKILLVAGAIGIATRPKVREGVAAKWEELRSGWASVSPGLFDGLAQLVIVYQEASTKAAQSKAELQAILPPPAPRTALQHARAVCLRNRGPVHLHELLRLMKVDGYMSASQTERTDLRNLLRSSGQFVENGRHEWMLAGTQNQRLAAPTEITLPPRRKRRSTARRRRVPTKTRRRRKPLTVELQQQT